MRQLFILSFTLFSIGLFSQTVYISEALEKQWETPEGLSIPESSFYNADDSTIYVSNIVGKHDEKDKIGYISKLNNRGQFISKEWVSGLNAPKGIGITNGKLYVTDIDEVVEISLESGDILKRYSSSIAKHLNDITTDKHGHVYVSEMQKHMVMMVGKDSLEVFVESEEISGVNGICDYFNELIVGSKGNLIAIDKTTKNIRVLAENTGYLDGIVVVDINHIITSDFKGKVQMIDLDNGIETLINTTSQSINAADIGYISDLDLLLIPTFKNNKVIGYLLK